MDTSGFVVKISQHNNTLLFKFCKFLAKCLEFKHYFTFLAKYLEFKHYFTF